jgi:ribosomal protein S18 acetylase RimI-like enzyme
MISIVRATTADAQLLADMGAKSFVESHGASATETIVQSYVREKYTAEIMAQELEEPEHIYHIIYQDQQPAGFSKIVHHAQHAAIAPQHVSKLERLYLLKELYSLGLGKELLDHNLALSRQCGQAGMWLFVWTGNERAVNFYTKAGFNIIGRHSFKLTDDHANPNHQMLLMY